MQYKTAQELGDFVANLCPAWNNLEVELLDPSLDDRMADERFPYARVTEHYQLGTILPLLNSDISGCGVSEVKVFQGVLPIGEPLRPLAITIRADGHSYLHGGQKERWPELLRHLQTRIDTLIKEGYVITGCKGLKNQKDDFPGTVDAEDSFHFVRADQ
ncbi:MAG: hypothetical protein KJ574_03745 [Nanoarchaeota archaeon]|nr:hypothetical protein [Nanoarchaeota archaeon]